VLSLAPDLSAPRRRSLVIATLLGAAATASLPLVLAMPDQLAIYYLALAGPLAAAAVGEALGQPWLRWTGMGITALAAVSPVLGVGQLLATMIVVGPLAALLTVGVALRLRDPFAGTAFLSASAIAITAGFVAAPISPPITIGLTVLVMAGGTATTLTRLP
jgi:hypothetical protein